MGFTDRQSEQASQSICDKTPNELTLLGTDADTQKKKDLLLARVRTALNGMHAVGTETKLWHLIAATSSPQWRAAKEALDAAERLFQEQHDPDNVPLGLVGHALEGAALNTVRDKMALSLAHFTLIDEKLRQREDLNEVLALLISEYPPQTPKQERPALSSVPVKKTGEGLLNRVFRLAAEKLRGKEKNLAPQPETKRALSLEMNPH